jgi:integrase
MSNYYTTKISYWNARQQFYFEVKNHLNKQDIKRFSKKNVEELVPVKKQIDSEIEQGLYGLENITLRNVYDKYIEQLEKRKNPPGTSTFKDYEYCAKQLWTINIKGKLIQNLSIKEFNTPFVNLINVYMNENFTVRYNEQCFNLLTRLFKYAVNHALGININPCRDVDRSDFTSIKKHYEENKDDPIVIQGGFDESLKKINGLLDKLKSWNFQHYVMVRLMCELGARGGEILPLLINDYNVGTNSIDINKTVNTGNNELHLMPKTQTGFRTVALSNDMGDLIKQLIKQHKLETKLLFPSSRNTIIQGNNFSNRILNKFNKELGIVGKINPHSFRVFVITLRDYLEHKKKNMMSDAGHASKQISDHYVRGKFVNFDKKREDANEIAGLLN